VRTALETPLRGVVGARTATVLDKELDLGTVGDLLTHYPRRYDERGELTDLASLRAGDDVTVLADVASVSRRAMRARRGSILTVTVTDGRGRLELTWFNQPWRERELRVGRRAFFAGQVKEFRGKRQLTNPDYELLDPDRPEGESLDEGALMFAGALIPIYRATAKCTSWVVRRSVAQALRVLDPPDDPLPAALRGRHRWPGLYDALRGIHLPADHAELARARERLTFDEAYLLQVALAQRRADAGRWRAHSRPGRPDGVAAAFDARLPFALTAGQREVGDVLARELAAEAPMHRLLQGEVGSGKTVCALRAMLQVVDSPAGTIATGQAALLAPTEVLATQHARGLTALLGDLARAGELGAPEQATRVVLLTGSQSAAVRRQALEAVSTGAAGIVVGTHALLSEPVGFADLGLVVVDEQHRFGVEQRDALRAKGGEAPPHVLVMTATPIPRTVAMTVYGDLEVSSLTELPAGRSPITTHVVPAGNERYVARTWQRVREEVEAGHLAFVVCPRIGEEPGLDEPAEAPQGGAGVPDADDESEGPGGPDAPARRPPVAVLDVLPLLRDDLLAGLRVGVLHGRLPTEEKDAVMRRVVAGEVDVLLATTVVEVGVDVPNATVMVVLDADRFGVSQLHQLRGRVGRGTAPAICLLVSEAEPGTPAHERLTAVAATTDGAQLARLDLAQRREGDVLGATQSGRRRTLKLLELLRHEDLITEAREEATRLVEVDPELTSSPALAAALKRSLDEESAAYLEKA
jgi:ATP-dependent DNA helicase RecG